MLLVTYLLVALLARAGFTASISVPILPAPNASAPIPDTFTSFSIEFSSFPDFAGNSSQPNTFSYNLLRNLGSIQGTNPIVRVGGNTQDYATYNASQSEAIIGIIDPHRNADYPTTISIGPSFFDSYSTWPNISFLHGLNMAKNGTVGHQNLLDTVPLVCKSLKGNKLAFWQLGNEPDLFKTSGQGIVRPHSWNESSYVEEWLDKTRLIRQIVQRDCPDVIEQGKFKFYAPSFAGVGDSLGMVKTWQAGLGIDKDITHIDSHNYIGGATQPGITLQGTLMNHTSTVLSVNKHVREMRNLSYLGLPYVLGEANSLYNEGTPGLSNTFGAALWVVDFNLYCAATGISRVHMHLGTNYRYASWQPIQTPHQTIGTKAPYYANIAVAHFLGDLTKGSVRVGDIELGSTYENAYAAYVNDRLTRIVVVQMSMYNYTGAWFPRPSKTFGFKLSPDSGVKGVRVQRLIANGSDAITGVTFDGYSYNYELDHGRPVLLRNVTRGENVQVAPDGSVQIEVPWSSAAILNFEW